MEQGRAQFWCHIHVNVRKSGTADLRCLPAIRMQIQ